MSLFESVREEEALHKGFVILQREPGFQAARWMIEDVFRHFDDLDGNFAEQFQTEGFDQRTFELFLFAYFLRCGFELHREHASPDFIVSVDGVKVAVEATTVNPPTAGVLAELGRAIADLSEAEMEEYLRHELPIRFGSPLFSKLKKEYWKLDQCKGLPLVLAVQAFHDDDALGMTDAALTSYVYGVEAKTTRDEDGSLAVEFDRIFEHTVGEKKIPSSFFGQPDTEHVSAVLFSNSGTVAKFSRMGYQAGVANDTTSIMRMGFALNDSPDAEDPVYFSYSLDAPPLVEPWGQGLKVLHNPNARYPLPLTFFTSAAQTVWRKDKPVTTVAGWHPFASKTLHCHMGELKAKLVEAMPFFTAPIWVGAITMAEFKAETGHPGLPDALPLLEVGWFADDSGGFLGVVLQDDTDGDWGFVVLARDQFFAFRAIDMESGIASRREAARELQIHIAGLAAKPQRVFHQEPLGDVEAV